MRIIAIIQARLGSTRLSGKVLLDLKGKTVLEQVIDRVRASRFIDDVIIATTIIKEDLKIVKLCADHGIRVYCGSENDVLERYYETARLFGADHIVRITSDCPMIDPSIIDDVIDLHLKEKADYTSNTLKETYPDGQDVEIFTFMSLKNAWKNAKLTSEREHVTPYIRNNPEFKLVNMECGEDMSNKRWTLDNSEDYEFIKIIFENLYDKNPLFSMEEIVKLINEKPEIERINENIDRNEGYKKSLREDRLLNSDNIQEK
ncbi:MAG: hypothetical protein C3F06_07795 [Candidatus Methanoperedenaceae archaeon]|nr:MAG: hypothetical protein C3F06_07795 [Candidatus Methanoperedenaceae archaeon]